MIQPPAAATAAARAARAAAYDRESRIFAAGMFAALGISAILRWLSHLPLWRRLVRRFVWWAPEPARTAAAAAASSSPLSSRNSGSGNAFAANGSSGAGAEGGLDGVGTAAPPLLGRLLSYVGLAPYRDSVNGSASSSSQQQGGRGNGSGSSSNSSSSGNSSSSSLSSSSSNQTSNSNNNNNTALVLYEENAEAVEWVNMCWRKAWRVYQRGLERWLADLLQPVLDGVVADGQVPRFVQRFRILEFTLDHEAPSFSKMRRRTSRKDSDLNGVVDVRYTGGARMLLLIEVGWGSRGGGKGGVGTKVFRGWRARIPVLVSDLDLECKMWMKLRLAPMPPYVGTLSLAFVGQPDVKVQLLPYNRVR